MVMPISFLHALHVSLLLFAWVINGVLNIIRFMSEYKSLLFFGIALIFGTGISVLSALGALFALTINAYVKEY